MMRWIGLRRRIGRGSSIDIVRRGWMICRYVGSFAKGERPRGGFWICELRWDDVLLVLSLDGERARLDGIIWNDRILRQP